MLNTALAAQGCFLAGLASVYETTGMACFRVQWLFVICLFLLLFVYFCISRESDFIDYVLVY